MDKSILEKLVCPMTRNSLNYDEENQELISSSLGLAFPIRNGIPILLIDEARKINEENDASL
tara:strand:- start:1414 stop:1599 length:186 start_codon:yes stop_codon:yes gene_type:complete